MWFNMLEKWVLWISQKDGIPRGLSGRERLPNSTDHSNSYADKQQIFHSVRTKDRPLTSNVKCCYRYTYNWNYSRSHEAGYIDGWHCLLNRSFGRRSKKTSKPRVTGLCAGNSAVTGEFPAQRASNAEIVSIWWSQHALFSISLVVVALNSQHVIIDVE